MKGLFDHSHYPHLTIPEKDNLTNPQILTFFFYPQKTAAHLRTYAVRRNTLMHRCFVARNVVHEVTQPYVVLTQLRSGYEDFEILSHGEKNHRLCVTFDRNIHVKISVRLASSNLGTNFGFS